MCFSQLSEEEALLECHVNICVPAAERVRVGFGGPWGLPAWELGLQVTAGHLQASLRVWDIPQLGVWPRAGRVQPGGVADCPCSWGPTLSSGTTSFIWESSVGRQGAWYLSVNALVGVVVMRTVGPRCRNDWYEVCPASLCPSAKCLLS